MPGLLSFIQDHDRECFDAIISLTSSDMAEKIAELIALLKQDCFQQLRAELSTQKSREHHLLVAVQGSGHNTLTFTHSSPA